MGTEFPVTKRAFLLRLADFDGDLTSLVDSISWDHVQPHMIYSAVLGRMPEMPNVDECYDAKQAFLDATASKEFRLTIIEDFLNAFPEKKRLIFVHVPKTAGTSLEMHLSHRAPLISEFLTSSDLYNKSLFFATLARAVKALTRSDSIVVGGHIPLLWFLDHNVIRANDTVFTVVRDPIDLQISYANYAAMIMKADPDLERDDTRDWLAKLNITQSELGAIDQSMLAKLVLRDNNVSSPNMLCVYFGKGDFRSAYNALRRCDVNICAFPDFSQWLEETWKVKSPSIYENKSTSVLRFNKISLNDRRSLMEKCGDDLILFKTIMQLPRNHAFSRRSLDLPPLVE